jgi:hypothetical protein
MHTGKIAATAAALVMAALIGQTAANAGPSDSNLAYVSRYIGQAADALHNDKSDYGGHRETALDDIARARADIASALAYDNSHERIAATTTANLAAEADFARSQAASDRNLAFVRTNLQHAIVMLQQDHHDYGGYRVKAINELEAARNQLATALTSVHPTMNSDTNIRYTRGYIARGISMLQLDKTDYHGHRAAAVRAMQMADADLLAALRADRADESIPSVQALTPLAAPAGSMRTQRASDRNIEYARAYVEHAIDMLKNDSHDYNGFRAKAVQQLVIAREQLLDALQSR